MSDYLWDKAGPPDPDVEHFEKLLGAHAYRGQAPLLPSPRRPRAAMWLAVATVAVAALVVLWWTRRDGGPAWAMTVEGEVTVDGQPMSDAGRLRAGAWLDTEKGRAHLVVDGLGSVDIEPGTRARIVEATGARRMELVHGTLAAKIVAPPRMFSVVTRRVTAIDLGCAFRLAVDENGDGRLTVSEGRVALANGGREVAVPAGSECNIDAHGAGVPYFSDAGEPFRAAMTAKDLPALLLAARAKDAATLEKLLPSLTAADQHLVQARLTELTSTKPDAVEADAPKIDAPKIDRHDGKRPGKLTKTAPPKVGPPPALPPKTPTPLPTRDKLDHDALDKLERSAP